MELISTEESVVVFGGKGMVGSAILRLLSARGYSRVFSPSRKDLNLLDNNAVKKWFQEFKPNVVILAAAKVGGILANNEYPADFILENLKIQNNVIENSWRTNVQKFLFLGSSCIYPKYATQPIKEEELLNGYLEPTNQWYAIAKIAGLKLCEALNRQYKFNSICLMPTNLYGPGDNYHTKNSHVLPALIKKFYKAKLNNEEEVICWGTGSPLREFLHVSDLAEACLFVLENWDIKSDTALIDDFGQKLSFLNVGTGKDISIYDLAALISKKIGFKGKIAWDNSIPDGTPKKQLDVRRINQMGWRSRITLEKGLEETINSYIEENKRGIKEF